MTIAGSQSSISTEFEQFERIAAEVGDGVHAAKPGSSPDMSWRTDAACRDTSPELFFPVGTTGLAVEQIDEAKEVCRGCASKEPCLAYALATNQDSGVWGASSEEDRRYLRRTFISRRR